MVHDLGAKDARGNNFGQRAGGMPTPRSMTGDEHLLLLLSLANILLFGDAHNALDTLLYNLGHNKFLSFINEFLRRLINVLKMIYGYMI